MLLTQGQGHGFRKYVKVLCEVFSFAYNSADTDQKLFIFGIGGTWECSLPFYIYGPLGHAPGHQNLGHPQ